MLPHGKPPLNKASAEGIPVPITPWPSVARFRAVRQEIVGHCPAILTKASSPSSTRRLAAGMAETAAILSKFAFTLSSQYSRKVLRAFFDRSFF